MCLLNQVDLSSEKYSVWGREFTQGWYHFAILLQSKVIFKTQNKQKTIKEESPKQSKQKSIGFGESREKCHREWSTRLEAGSGHVL